MKKKVLAITMMGMMTVSAHAQVYANDSWTSLPTVDLYDQRMMDMYIRAWAETAEIRKANFYRYSELATQAFMEKKWKSVIYYVNEALETKYYSGELYYTRGYAYEQLGNIRAAKKDYKIASRNKYSLADKALEALKNRKKK